MKVVGFTLVHKTSLKALGNIEGGVCKKPFNMGLVYAIKSHTTNYLTVPIIKQQLL